MPSLPLFSFNLTISPNEGREDKIDLVLGTWKILASSNELDEVREFISLPPEYLRKGARRQARQNYGWLFIRPSNPQGRRNPLQIRGSRFPFAQLSEHIEIPLFGGHWMLRYTANDKPNRNWVSSVLRLALNPQRFVRHQSLPRSMASPASRRRSRITESLEPPSTNGEFSLDGKDNWIPNTGKFQTFASHLHWPRHLRSYVHTVGENFTEELRRVCDNAQTVRMSHSEDFKLRKVETAFDFAATNPTELVRSLAPLLSAYRASNAEVSEFRPPRLARDENSLSVKVQIRNGVSLRVYAKTNRRVRFEIIHDSINHRELLREPQQDHGQSVQRQRPWRDLPKCLAALREKAADEMNELFAYFRKEKRIIPSHISPMSFLVSVASILCDREMTHTVVSLLSANGTIASRGASEELRSALLSLTKHGVLKYDSECRGYKVCAPYRHALSMLRSEETLHLLTTARVRIPSGS